MDRGNGSRRAGGRLLDDSRQFDLAIIGSGPAGQKAAISAAKAGARVAIVERDPFAGGVCLNTGTVPSKTLREAVLYLTGYRQRGFYGAGYRTRDAITPADLLLRTQAVIEAEREAINHGLDANGVARIVGTGRVAGPHEVAVAVGKGYSELLTAHRILVCVGTAPRRPANIPFDGQNVFDSDTVFGAGNEMRPLPDSIIVLGAGVIGIEYASMYAALDIPTTLVDARTDPLEFVDDGVSRLLYEILARAGVQTRFGERAESVEIVGTPGDHRARVKAHLSSSGAVEADELLFALGRAPVTERLGLAEAGVATTSRGHIVVDDDFRTSVPSIFAAGDVVGFPSLASTSAEQGRVAALRALGIAADWNPGLLPYGVYTIPEISMIGKTEQELSREGVDFIPGVGLWRETARGNIMGDRTGAIKLLFAKGDHRLLGVHILGEGATELVHIGQAVMRWGGGIDYFTDMVFNYPTLAEAYKIAAFNALNRLRGNANKSRSLCEEVFDGRSPSDWLQPRP